MENFTPFASLIGGMLIGLSATIMLLLHGRVTGISGIIGGALDPRRHPSERPWRFAFLGGLLLGAIPLLIFMPQYFAIEVDRSTAAIVAAGALVGVGTRLGSGCTSGHGVCGISRLSPRSMVATGTFMFTGAVTVWVVRTFFGGEI